MVKLRKRARSFKRNDLFSPHATMARKKRENRLPKIRKRKFFFFQNRRFDGKKGKNIVPKSNRFGLIQSHIWLWFGLGTFCLIRYVEKNSVIQLFKNLHAKTCCFRQLFLKNRILFEFGENIKISRIFWFPVQWLWVWIPERLGKCWYKSRYYARIDESETESEIKRETDQVDQARNWIQVISVHNTRIFV